MDLPFTLSRRLTGANLYFNGTGAVLELSGVRPEPALLTGWRERVARAQSMLDFADRRCVVRVHERGASLALTAPADQLFVATEINEWALCASLHSHAPQRWRDVGAVEIEAEAMQRFRQLAATEQRPRLQPLIEAANARRLQHVLDDSNLTVGGGRHAQTWMCDALPASEQVDWLHLANVPTAVVTGSNGKTTTVRLLAACARAQGWQPAWCCTDGVYVGDQQLANGDYSGPEGARLTLRARSAEAAIVEAARGGLLRRGLAVSRAQVAVITNISADHFGEYGIDTLEDLADAKLTVAAALPDDGLLVLNADDPLLTDKATTLGRRFGRAPPIGWFALDADCPRLVQHRQRGGATCGVRQGQLSLAFAGREYGLGAIRTLPLALDGNATYNIANLAAAALAAAQLGVAPATIARALAQFGLRPEDNPGRLMRYEVNGATVLVDYAHNPEGLRGLLGAARHLRRTGRLATLLGHAGNRQDADIEQLAQAAAGFHPDLIVIKENESHLRGRAPGEIPGLLRAALLRAGVSAGSLAQAASEAAAARIALQWARPGDLLALPIHASQARAAVLQLIHEMNGLAAR